MSIEIVPQLFTTTSNSKSHAIIGELKHPLQRQANEMLIGNDSRSVNFKQNICGGIYGNSETGHGGKLMEALFVLLHVLIFLLLCEKISYNMQQICSQCGCDRQPQNQLTLN